MLRMAVSVPPSAPVSTDSPFDEVALSADGTHIVYRSGNELRMRALDQLESVPLRGTEDGEDPFFSPDGAWVGFQGNRALQKVSIQGGPAVTICELPGGLRGAGWGDDDRIVFGIAGSGLFHVAAAGGEPEALTETEDSHRWPDVLPDGGGVLFSSLRASVSQISVLDLTTGQHEVIIPNGTDPHYAPTGHIVYALEGTLRAVAFDLESLRVTSDPVPVVEDVLTKTTGSASFDPCPTPARSCMSAVPQEPRGGAGRLSVGGS